ncbi:MAG: DUF1456 family protein [Methylococcales bacterium]|jgi:uncharacterized protein YehS (DUF1456 family)|nr:DUF1456 family protein [Methylococcales bacterium]MBT7442355.1 DUF1456 family protein [Methylococcales bacterium]
MINNDVLRRLRYTFNFDDSKVIAIFALADKKVSREEISNWLKKDDDPDYVKCSDPDFATFLNGLINEKRGKKEGAQPEVEQRLNNNIIFRKLKIALNLKNEDVIDLLLLADFKMSKHELSAFFRKPGHKNYRDCKDQVLRNFLMGAQLKYRESEPEAETEPDSKIDAKTETDATQEPTQPTDKPKAKFSWSDLK